MPQRLLALAALCLACIVPASAQSVTLDIHAVGGPRLVSAQPEFGVRTRHSHQSRPAGCPRAWCGCWMALQVHGKHVRRLWLARNWAYEGVAAHRGCIGCVAVLSRGRRGGHVGRVVGWQGPNPVIVSGNHNRSVGTAVYPVGRLIALRRL